MQRRVHQRIAVVLAGCVAAAVAPVASAAEVYRWVDAQGVVHYSDTKPDERPDVDTLVVAERNPPGYDPAEDPYSILNQAERTAGMLDSLEKERETRSLDRQASRPDIVYVDARNRSPFLYGDRWPPFGPPIYLPPRPLPGNAYRRQWSALDYNGLTGPRPYSINSGEHAARVARSQALPLTPARPGPRPGRPRPRL